MRCFFLALVLSACVGCSPSVPSWSVAVVPSSSLLTPPIPASATLSRIDICDGKPCDLADPFIIKRDGAWYLFFEHVPPGESIGKIAVASSQDGEYWTYQGIVLQEPFHLSFPYVFKHKDEMYMIPESRKGGGIFLYRASAFPRGWRRERLLVAGNYADPTIIFYKKKWWLFAVRDAYSLAIFFSDSLQGPWKEHRLSPLYPDDKGRARPGGRLLITEHGLIRFAQDNREGYGNKLRGFLITKLTPTAFEEREVEPNPVLRGDGIGWNALGMHQFDASQATDDTDSKWLIAVDGFGFPEDDS